RILGNDPYHEISIGRRTITSDGGLVLTGRYANTLDPFYDVKTFVMKVDACGCLVPDCDPNCIASTTGTQNTVHSFVLYPNPAKEQLLVQSSENFVSYTIFNVWGSKSASGMLR